jgi:hypothetical protein
VSTIVYLDPEDEITSAAMRIRHAPERRVALVVPFGSRVATSRINFRLLAREAMRDGRRLDIVAPDASARALAASAGIPVFASVAEYEAALDVTDLLPAAGAAAAGAAAAGAAGAPGAAAGTGPADVPAVRGRDATDTLPAGAVAGFAAGAAAAGAARGLPDPGVAARLDAVMQRSREAPAVARPAQPPVVRKRRRLPVGLVAGLLLLVAALGVAGVAAYLFLPAATITVTPRIEPVGPVTLDVTADPGATAVDEEALVIPAEVIEIPVEASGEFPATGKRVEKTPATGTVRWTNCDPTAAYTIPRGSQVRTADGIAFATDESVFLPVAIISGGGTSPELKCQSNQVAVTAVKPGESGNVAAGTIRVVPGRYNRNVIRVTNQEATAGGTETSFTRISKKDVDSALLSLQADLETSFAEEVESPDRVPPGHTVYPATAVLGESTPVEDPEALIGQEVESFTLALTATGSVLTVDTSPIEGLAAGELDGMAAEGAELVDGSAQVTVGEGSVREDGTVAFEATVSAQQVVPVDPAMIEALVLGMTPEEASQALAPYGATQVELWPGFATTIPTLAQRVTVIVSEPSEAAGVLDGGAGGEPLPSG